MESVEKRAKERKLSLSFLRRSLSRKQSQSQPPAPIVNGSTATESQVTTTAVTATGEERQRRNVLKNWRKKIHLREPFLVWRAATRRRATTGAMRDDEDEPPPVPLVTPPPLPPRTCGGVSSEVVKLAREGWYWGPVSRQEAEDRLRGQPDGTFLVRDSSSDSYLFTVSFRSSGKTLHSRIDYDGRYSLYSSLGFESVAELIGHSMSCSKGAVYCYSQPNSPTQPEFPVRLSSPLSRFTQVRTLQYLCRFVIRQHTGLTDIHKLPLPPTIKGYIQEGHY